MTATSHLTSAVIWGQCCYFMSSQLWRLSHSVTGWGLDNCYFTLNFSSYLGAVLPLIIIIIYPLTTRSLGHHRWFCNHFPPFFPVLHCPLGLGELQACPFPDVVFPPLPLSALSSSLFHCALQEGLCQTWWMGDMTIPLQFASLYGGQEVFVWSSCLLDLGTDFLAGNMVFVWDA